MKKTLIFLALVCATQVQAQDINTKYGIDALISNAGGGNNSAFGENALRSNTSGWYNTATGHSALVSNTAAYWNTATGTFSLSNNINGSSNTATGALTLGENIDGSGNTATGFQSLNKNTTGNQNTATGTAALFYNNGSYNTANGTESMLGDNENYAISTGSYNTASGYRSLANNLTGNNNVALGAYSGYSNKIGSNSVFIGRNAGFFETTGNKLYIANNATIPLIYGVFSGTAANTKLGIGTSTVATGDAIKVWNGARLSKAGVWTNASSRKLKDNIETISTEDANEALAGLLPVRYVYKNSRDEEYMGFIAEDVPELVASNDRKSLSPMDIVAVLTTVVKDQEARIQQLELALAKQ